MASKAGLIEALRAVVDPDVFERALRFVGEPALQELLRLPRTDTLQATVDSIRAAIIGLEGNPNAEAIRPKIEAQLARAEAELAKGLRRDAIEDERPAGCWCLGLGGRHEAGVPVPTDEVDGDGRTVVEIMPAFREYCGCEDGVAAQKAAADANVARERWYTRRRVDGIWSKASIPDGYRDCTLENYPGDPMVVPVIRDWLETDRWLVLGGEYGAGKTSLACSILRALAERGESILFVNAPSMLRRVRSTYGAGNDGPTEGDVIRSLVEVDALVLDDLGKERMTEWALELLYDVVNQRYSEGRRLVLTTNLPLRAVKGEIGLEGHVGAATFWRIFERSLPITVTGNLRLVRA